VASPRCAAGSPLLQAGAVLKLDAIDLLPALPAGREVGCRTAEDFLSEAEKLSRNGIISTS
jgi:hypothetical protein